MIRRIKTGWALSKKSWAVIRADKSLLIFPILSSIFSIIAFIILFVPAGIASGLLQDASDVSRVPFYIFLVVSAYVTTTIAVFFNVALASCAIRSFEGEDTTVKQGISLAWERKRQIVAWAAVAATVGLVIRALQERFPFVGAVLAFIGGLAWGIATWFVIPSLVVDGLGPIDSIKKSVSVVKARWGEGISGTVAIGGIFVVLLLVLIPVAIAGAVLLGGVSAPATVLWVMLCFVVMLVLALISSAMHQVFDVAVYLTAQNGAERVGPFTAEEIDSTISYKKSRQV